MANVKITELTALTNPTSTDVLPIVDVVADVTKKVSIADLLKNAGSGTAAAPGIAFDGDSNTGIYRPGADQIALATNGAQALYIDSDGDILVADGNRMEIDEIRARDGAGLKLFDDAGAGIFVQDGGNVGVGTSTPGSYDSNANNLVVANTSGNAGISIVGATTGNSSLYFGDGTGASTFRGYIDYLHSTDVLRFGTGASTRAVIDSSGNVGIGTTSPQDTLQIGADTTAYIGIANSGSADVTSGINWRYGSGGSALNKILAAASGIGNTYLAFHTTAANTTSEAVRIDSSGRVGIGTTSPGSYNSSANALVINANSGGTGLTISSLDTNKTLATTSLFFADGTTGDEAYRGVVRYHHNDDAMQLWTAGSERVRIDSSGRLLVGTSSDQSISSDANALVQIFTSTAAKLLLGREDSVVEDDDFIGIIDFHSTDGGSQRVARIACQADGDHAADDKPGRLVFSTTADGTSSPTERMRITSDAYVRLASGTGGIQFNGDTAAANALDDYEEGTHTTTATTTSGTITLSSTNNELAYIKIGKLVSVHGRVNVSAISSPTGNLKLSLPFVAADLDDSAGRSAGSINIRLVAATYDVGLFSCYLDEGSSNLAIAYGGSTDIVAAAPAITASTQIWISITYRTI